ncbi:MAG: hypothetical protein H5U40_15580 [Polyangiaceae bacterium]|nr:hypothetical protein [Polyangiaceae bacterium]
MVQKFLANQRRREATMPEQDLRGAERYSRGDLVARGAFAGLIGSIVMGTVGVAVAGLKGPSFAVPMSVLAANAIRGGADSELVVVGALLHMLVGSGFGAVFALLLPRASRIPTILGFGMLYGLVLHVVMVYGVLRPLELVRTTARVDTWWFLSEHLVYGLTLGIVMAAWLSAGRSERTMRAA